MFHARLVACLCSLFFGLVLVAGCGRSDLDQGLSLDAGPIPTRDGATCNVGNCPNGCCDSNGVCQAGTSTAACGANGTACAACPSNSTCAPSTQTCTNVNPTCNASNCPNGCCDASGTCQAGNQLTACGTSGVTCANCPAEGLQQCDPNMQVCDTPVATCDPSSCPNGCCQPDGMGGFLCIDGTESATCGSGGQGCQNCSSVGAVCDANAHQCVAPTCGPQNCGGCCLGNTCIMGGTQNACGLGGQQCQNCGPGGACVGGGCQISSCSPANCGGCCDQNGVCQGGGDSFDCGFGGNFCQVCPGNAFCNGGQCISTGSCSPQNCPGCCDQNGVCQGGGDPFNCGQGGSSCFACPPGLACQFGQCVPNGGCGPQNCPGCCDFNGICQGGNSPAACGSFGQFCNFCPANSACEGGNCVQQNQCGPQNCDGCCDPSGICQGGTTNALCGLKGESCVACPATFTCTGSICEKQVMACGPANCSGCCNGTTCETGTSVAGCGLGGGQCATCPANDVCTMGSCQVPPCGPNNCNGCCGTTGGSPVPVCLGGGAPTACGVAGNSCTVCPPGETCQGGFCQIQFDAGPCGPNNCGGCCENNVCVGGFSVTGCGFGGQQCSICPPNDVCPNGFCQLVVDSGSCSPSDCAGCCEGNTCVTGNTTNECGSGGQQCSICGAGLNCNSGFCSAGDGGGCGPFTCSGCCDDTGICQPGDTNNQCGNGGEQCLVCSGNSTCSGGFGPGPGPGPGPGFDGGFFGGGTCQFNNNCGSFNCAGCCDTTGVCHGGTTQGLCGNNGNSCSVCPANSTCNASGVCVASTACGPANCTGCCDSQGLCEAGFIDTACGVTGGKCEDCTMQNPPSVCDSNVTPRTCSNQQSTCPGPYASCPAGTTTPIIPVTMTCPATDLANVQEACNAGATSTSCSSFFQFEQSANPGCYSCLENFNIDYNVSPTGIFKCLAPFVGSQCNQQTGCADDCSAKSCAACPAAALSSCEQTVLGGVLNGGPAGQCTSYLTNLTCVFNALQGQGSFCQPFAGYGDWLQAVGQYYCGQ